MACSADSHTAGASAAAPGQYRELETPGDRPQRWVHDGTGLVVDLFRYARAYRHDDAFADCHEYQLVVRPGGADAEGRAVERTIEGDPEAMALAWMREHADGTVDLEAEALGVWE